MPQHKLLRGVSHHHAEHGARLSGSGLGRVQRVLAARCERLRVEHALRLSAGGGHG
jgi:hypothetical protein